MRKAAVACSNDYFCGFATGYYKRYIYITKSLILGKIDFILEKLYILTDDNCLLIDYSIKALHISRVSLRTFSSLMLLFVRSRLSSSISSLRRYSFKNIK